MPTEQIFTRIRRAMMLEASAYEEARDDATFTPYALVAAAVAVILAAVGAWLWAETVLETTPDGWFVDTILLGTLFSAVLLLVGIGVMYVVLTRALGETVASPDGFLRVALLGHLGYAVSLLIFIPELGFAFALLAMAFVFYDTSFGIRSAYPAMRQMNVVIAVTAGLAAWMIILALFSSFPDNNWATGPFVYSLFE